MIVAVIVLYKQTPPESQALSALRSIFEKKPGIAAALSLVIYDNSPSDQSDLLPGDVSVHYKYSPENSGLATAYSYALDFAEKSGCEWLLLLDQDTSPTDEFLEELLQRITELRDRPEVAAIIPKLIANGRMYSPAPYFIDQLRQQYPPRSTSLGSDIAGVQQKRLDACNSGTTLRISSLELVGGFPKGFWLDFLDHEIFFRLFNQGYRMYVLHSRLDHDASHTDLGTVPMWRFRKSLVAQADFVRRAGKSRDRLLYRTWLLRYSLHLWRFCKEQPLWRQAALQAILLKSRRSDERDAAGGSERSTS